MKYLLILLLSINLMGCGKTGLHRFEVGDCVELYTGGGEFTESTSLGREVIIAVGWYDYHLKTKYGKDSENVWFVDTSFRRCK